MRLAGLLHRFRQHKVGVWRDINLAYTRECLGNIFGRDANAGIGDLETKPSAGSGRFWQRPQPEHVVPGTTG